MDGCNLTAYNLSTGEYNIYKNLSPTFFSKLQALGGNEWYPKHMLYSEKQHIFLVVFELCDGTNEVVIYRDLIELQVVGEKVNTFTGRDWAFIGPLYISVLF